MYSVGQRPPAKQIVIPDYLGDGIGTQLLQDEGEFAMSMREKLTDKARARVALLAIGLVFAPSLLVGATTSKNVNAMTDLCCEASEGGCEGGHSFCQAFQVGTGVMFCYQGAPLSCDE